MARTICLSPPIGVVLAGGGGRRIGGDKARVEVLGRPLISYPLAALRSALAEVVVLAKPSTALPDLPDTAVWLEAEKPQHPLFGIVRALELAAGRTVLVCAADLPLVGTELLVRLLDADAELAAIAGDVSGPQPLVGCYQPAALGLLRDALVEYPLPRMRSVGGRLSATVQVTRCQDELLNVNHPEDLRRAAACLHQREVQALAQPNVKL